MGVRYYYPVPIRVNEKKLKQYLPGMPELLYFGQTAMYQGTDVTEYPCIGCQAKTIAVRFGRQSIFRIYSDYVNLYETTAGTAG
jgi:hypothetical protein